MNAFVNDGSFLERFKKMQESTKKEPSTAPTTGVVTATNPGLSIRLEKTTRKSGSALTRNRVADVFGEESDSEEDVSGEPKAKEKKEANTASPSSSLLAPSAYEKPLISVAGARGAMTGTKLPSGAMAGTRPLPGTMAGTRPLPGAMAGTRPLPGTMAGTGPPPGATVASSSIGIGQKRKRRSRWSDIPPTQPQEDSMISNAISSFNRPSAAQMTPEQIRQMIEQQEMNKLMEQVRSAARMPDKHASSVEYHHMRAKEMKLTEEQSKNLTDSGKGKHFIGDFLPKEELDRFIEKVTATKEDRDPDLSDYSKHKLTSENVGYQLLQKAGWAEGSGLGTQGEGIIAPINKGKQSFDQSGVGAVVPGEVTKEDDVYDTYRKRMMLAYRFRPNPLNNPRRPYY